MTAEITADSLLHYLETELGLERSEVGPTTALFSSGLLDSFAVADLLVFLEEAEGYEIDPLEIVPENFDSVERILDNKHVRRKLVDALLDRLIARADDGAKRRAAIAEVQHD